MTPKPNQETRQTNQKESLISDQQIDADMKMNDFAAEEFEKAKSQDNQPVKPSQTKKKENQTDKVKWSIFTEIETKTISHKASKKAGLKLNEWIDRALREKGTEELTQKADPPAKTEDLVKDIVAQFAEKMEAAQEASRKTQNELIEKQGQQLADLTKAIQNQPRSFKEMIFGRKGE